MFFSFDKRMVFGIMVAVIVLSIIDRIMYPESLLGLVLSIPGLLIAITFHEFAHAYSAYKLGDYTAKEQGRITLNPFKHMDPIGMIMLLIFGFGWGKPVQVNSRNFTRKLTLNKAEAIVAFAGPAMNFILAIIFSIIYVLVLKYNVFGNLDIRAQLTIYTIISAVITLNVGLGVFNLIPLPPLDGSKILCGFLPYSARNWFMQNEMYFYIAFVVLFVTRLGATIVNPIIAGISNGMLDIVSKILI